MNCKKVNLQMFIDWLHAGHEYMFQNVVTAWGNLSRGGLSDIFATGFLSFVPTHIIGFPLGPTSPMRDFSDYFQGNLLNTLEGTGHSHMIIKLADPVIEIYLLNVQNDKIETSGATVTIRTEGDDGLAYEIILSARKVFAVPHQITP